MQIVQIRHACLKLKEVKLLPLSRRRIGDETQNHPVQERKICSIRRQEQATLSITITLSLQ